MFNPRSTRSPTMETRLPLTVIQNVQSALHAEPDTTHKTLRGPRGECSIRAPRGARQSQGVYKTVRFPECSIRAPRGARQQKQPIACLSLLLYYSIFYRILQASDTYKTPVTAKKLKIRCEIPDDFVFARVSHL